MMSKSEMIINCHSAYFKWTVVIMNIIYVNKEGIMKKLKKLRFVELTKEEQDNLKGGCSCDGHCSNWSVPIYCPDSPYYPPSPNPEPKCQSYICMPGDNASTASWFGTKLAEEYAG